VLRYRGDRERIKKSRVRNHPRRCVVLSDHERKALREVERRLVREDPEFARSFDARAHRLSRASRDGARIKLFLLAGSLLSSIALIAGSLSGAVTFAVATALIGLVWRFSTCTDEQSR
jgi:hypothetical protein